MATRLNISTRDLKRLAVVSDLAHLQGPRNPLPYSVLQALADLVPCDTVTFQVQEPARRAFIAIQELDDTYENNNDNDDDAEVDFYWNEMWPSVPWNPCVTGDYVTVRRERDMLSAAKFSASAGAAYMRMGGMRHLLTIPFPHRGSVDYRLMLWRTCGPGFSDREVVLLQLLRPHLVLLLEEVLRREGPAAALTPRQRQVLELVAEGRTNLQVAHRLNLAEGTVRQHLENIYRKLHVDNRTAAVTTALRAYRMK
jgi:DNA-binding CsgD family transcriptional regulator